jgi:uncharacterized protein YsxB (DUF464 family)
MILVQVNRNYQKCILSFTLSGHAESGPYGHDLVCAAVSAVSIGAINAVEELCAIEPKVETRDDGGFLQMYVPSSVDGLTAGKIQLILQAMLVSLKTIERDYSQYITISES